MFKKLVVGALATGIALTGGAAASASTEGVSVDNTKKSEQELVLGVKSGGTSAKYGFDYRYDASTDKFYTNNFFKKDGVFANSFYDSGINWYYKGRSVTSDKGGGFYGHYEGRSAN